MRLTAALATVTAAALLTTGCSGTPGSDQTPTASTSANQSPTPSPASTLTAAEERAVLEARKAVPAYEQMFYDILADPEPNLNDMNQVAAQPQLAGDLKNLQRLIGEGGFTIDSTGPVTVVSSELVSVALDDDPPTVVVRACVDKSAASGTQDGQSFTGVRQEAQYEIVKTSYLPAPGWAVANVQPPEGFDQPQPC